MCVMAIGLMALVLVSLPALAGDGEETRSTVAFGPDLAVSAGDIILSKPVLMTGVDFNVTVKVYNLGDEDATGVTIDLLVDTETADQANKDLVPVDGWVTVTFGLALSQGEHSIGILVDGNDAIDEKREDNNGASLDVRVKGLPDATIDDEDLSVSSAHPMEGEVLTIKAVVHNQGESSAPLVVVQFWDGKPGTGDFIQNATTSVPEGSSSQVTIQWDTTGLGGTHEIHVLISRVQPGEEITYNNMASIQVLIFTDWDMVIDSTTGNKNIDQEYTQDGFVTVRDGATLTVTGVEMEFNQDYDNQFALFVEDGGSLVLDGSVVWSDFTLLVILGDGTSLHMSSMAQLWATILVQGDVTVTIEDSVVDGAIMGSASQVTLEDTEVTGEIDLNGGRLDVVNSLLTTSDVVTLTAIHAVLVDSVVPGPADPSIALYAGATVELRNVTCRDVYADATSTAMVFRRVEVRVEDESTLVIPEASITIEHFINGTVVGSATGGTDGRALIEVLSDIIRDGESHFIGNYKVRSTFSGNSGSEPLLLAPFPAMDRESNLPSATVVLPPVDPRILIDSTPGDMVIEAGDEIPLSADFIQDGNIVVRGTLTVATSTLTVRQERDHQYYVVVESGGLLELHGATITSDYPLNIYLSGDASLVMGPGSFVDVTALVTEDGATVEARAAKFDARLLLRGGQFTMRDGCSVEGDLMVVETPKLEIHGGEVLSEEIYIDSPAAAIMGITLNSRMVDMVASFANITDSTFTVDSLSVEANILTITGSELKAEEPLDMQVATIYMDSSSSNQPLASAQEGSKVYLYDAQVPYPFSMGNATVLVYWYLTVIVQDVLSNPVANVDVEISYTYNQTAVTSGVTNDDGQVRFPLLGSIVTPEGERFVGNYRIVAYNPKKQGETEIRYVNLDMAKSMINSFKDILVPPTMIDVDIAVINTTVVAGTEFFVNGIATAIFPTVRSPLNQGTVEVNMWDNGSTWSNVTTLDANGAFQVGIPAPMVDGVYYIQALVTPTGDYEGVPDDASNIITMNVEPPGPTSLVIVLESNVMNDFPTGGMLTVRGTVKYNTAQGAPASNVRVFLDDPISHQKYQVFADGLGVFQFPPRVGPAFFGQYDYFLSAQDDDLDIETTSPVKLTVIAVKVKEEQTDDNDWLLWTLIAVVVAVAAIGGTLGYWAFSSKGRMVECGECGTLVPESATECPKCGIEFEVEVAKCSECESWIRSDATTCPYCNTPFRSLDEVGEGEGATPVDPEATEGDVVAEVPSEETATGGTDDGVVVDENALKATPETIKQAPNGLKKEVRPKPVVQRKAVAPTDEEFKDAVLEDDPNQVVRPRVVRKVATAPPETGAISTPDDLDTEFEAMDLEEDKEDL